MERPYQTVFDLLYLAIDAVHESGPVSLATFQTVICSKVVLALKKSFKFEGVFSAAAFIRVQLVSSAFR